MKARIRDIDLQAPPHRAVMNIVFFVLLIFCQSTKSASVATVVTAVFSTVLLRTRLTSGIKNTSKKIMLHLIHPVNHIAFAKQTVS